MSVVASLIPGQSPPLVQIVVDEAPVGEGWRLIGRVGDYTPGLAPGGGVLPGDDTLPADSAFTPGAYSWVVPGGRGVGAGEQLVLVDNLSPGNIPYVYTFETDSGSESSSALEVPFQETIVLQTLDGQSTIDLKLLDGSLGMELEPSVESFRVPGRKRPVIRYDVLSDNAAALVVLVPMGMTPQFREVLTSGAPIVYRFGDNSYDLPPVGVISVTSVSSEPYPTADMRVWTLGYVLIDNPHEDIRLGAFTWDAGFDASFLGRPWTDFDAAFSGLTWDAFDTTDWTAI